jgi:hypothetical protein
MATAIEIPRNSWTRSFNALSKEFQGWGVTVEVLDHELGDQRAEDGLPLQGVSYETKGSQAGDILIEAGDKDDPFETHLIHRPKVVRLAATQPGVEADIEIEDEEGITTLVRLRLRPELPAPPPPPRPK